MDKTEWRAQVKILPQTIYDEVFDSDRMNTMQPKVYHKRSSAPPPFLITGGPSGKEAEGMKSTIGDTKLCH